MSNNNQYADGRAINPLRLSAQKLADNILADGLIKYIGDGLSVEIATESAGEFWGNEFGSPMAYVYHQQIPRSKTRYSENSWRHWRTIRADDSGAMVVMIAGIEEQIVNKNLADSAITPIRLSGIAGSENRIEAMAKHYAAQELTENPTSAFSVSDGDIAERLADLASVRLQGRRESGVSAGAIHFEREKPEKSDD